MAILLTPLKMMTATVMAMIAPKQHVVVEHERSGERRDGVADLDAHEPDSEYDDDEGSEQDREGAAADAIEGVVGGSAAAVRRTPSS